MNEITKTAINIQGTAFRMGAQTEKPVSNQNARPVRERKIEKEVHSADMAENARITAEENNRLHSLENSVEKIKTTDSQAESEKDTQKEMKSGLVLDTGESVRLSYNKEISRFIIKVVDKSSGEPIREVPPESTQRMYERLRQMTGIMMDQTI